MSQSSEKKHGPWKLLDVLGRGGNATVWRATRPGDEQRVALKVISTKKVEKEPYQRFIREIEFLRDHEGLAGVLPVLDAYLPDPLTAGEGPWLAMPIAVPMVTALAERSLADVVEGVAAIAETLARLQATLDVAHRDIKPGNLYELDRDWLIGDFGLIALPDAPGLTVNGRPLGPAHYTAYEMILDPAGANPHPADVYSLGKTLWVLATGQAFPPEGHQPEGTRQFGIGDFRPHPKAGALDRLVDQMTRLHPEERPSKDQVARDLRSWSELASEAPAIDVSDLRARLHTKLQREFADQDIKGHRKDLALAAVRRLQALTGPLNEALKSLYPQSEIDSQSDELTKNILRSHPALGDREIDFRWQRCTIVAPFRRQFSLALRMGRSVELREDGMLLLHLMVDVGLLGAAPSTFHWNSPELSAPVGSVEAEHMIEEGVRQLRDALSDGLDVFVEQVPAGS